VSEEFETLFRTLASGTYQSVEYTLVLIYSSENKSKLVKNQKNIRKGLIIFSKYAIFIM
jgi:hypothetical protein